MRLAHDRDHRDTGGGPHGLLDELPVDVLFVMFGDGGHDGGERGDRFELVFFGDGAAELVEIRDFGGIIGFVFLDQSARDFGGRLEEAFALGGQGGFGLFVAAAGEVARHVGDGGGGHGEELCDAGNVMCSSCVC